jgi:membrane protein DedA with SNARE-associated domain
MRVLRIVLLLVTAALAGMLLGAVVGYGIGMWMARSYQPYGPSDPRDAPIYVALGLTMFSAMIGAAIAVVAVSIRLWHRRKKISPASAV